MLPRIVLLGKDEKKFQYVRKALKDFHFACDYVAFAELDVYPEDRLQEVKLVIVDTLPYAENQFRKLLNFRERSGFSRALVLTLVKNDPPRLRYKLIGLGVSDYLPVPFDKLDLQLRVRQLLRLPSNNAPAADNRDNNVLALKLLSGFARKVDNIRTDSEAAVLLPKLLATLRSLARAQATMLLRVDNDETLLPLHIEPEDLVEADLNLPVAENPVLLKAVRMGETSVLNHVQASNPFIIYLSPFINLPVSGFIVHPMMADNQTRFVLVLLKSDEEKLAEYHYLLVQHFSMLIGKLLLSNRPALPGEPGSGLSEPLLSAGLPIAEVLKQLNFGLIVLDSRQKIVYLNNHAGYLFGIPAEAALNKHLNEIVGEKAALDILESPRTYAMKLERPEIEITTPGGRTIYLGYTLDALQSGRGEEIGSVLSLKDITHRKEIQEELRTVDRLASLGVMASGIAHEIRNPLAGIKAMAQTFEEEVEEGDPKREYVQRIIRLVNRLDDLLKTLFSYAKPSKPNRKGHHFEHILKDVLSLLNQKLADQNIRLEKNISPDLPLVYVDAGQIQQILINLLLNALEAMHSDGEISISIKPFGSVDPGRGAERSAYHSLIDSTSFVEVRISDNGCGIAPENMKHIFNPFFTTKTFGTGLGLSIVFQLVKENDAQIYYESEIDRGTDCFLLLPAKVKEEKMSSVEAG